MNETIQVLKTRRSCRKYLNKQVPRELLNQILEAGTYAANGRGRQSAVIVVIQDPQTVNKISKLNAQVVGTDADPFYGAPTVLIVFADTKAPTYLYDGALVMGNLMNAAHAVGVDSCYIFRAKQVFETEEGRELMKKWGISEEYEGIGNCILGYAAEGGIKEAAPRKADYVIFGDEKNESNIMQR